ncbi:hypothetical protein BLNAU_10955 [Blattamonas nauphoetae]|uniref:Uncharacterized protein n=1 Tax=Blattamonas nauphoetae TaxID=2049346 RepID=A0ABQ9XRM1_9EUKA|nr:hypothetical protein BLNAU_10955 [Blattamonas nauphoetae]
MSKPIEYSTSCDDDSDGRIPLEEEGVVDTQRTHVLVRSVSAREGFLTHAAAAVSGSVVFDLSQCEFVFIRERRGRVTRRVGEAEKRAKDPLCHTQQKRQSVEKEMSIESTNPLQLLLPHLSKKLHHRFTSFSIVHVLFFLPHPSKRELQRLSLFLILPILCSLHRDRAFSSSAPAVGSSVAVDSTGIQVSIAALPVSRQHPSMQAVNEADDVMCVGQNASDCGDSVASREVGCVDVLSALLHATVFACSASLQLSQQQSRPSLECGCGCVWRRVRGQIVGMRGVVGESDAERHRASSLAADTGGEMCGMGVVHFRFSASSSLQFPSHSSSISPPSTHFHFLRPSFSSQRALSVCLNLPWLSPLLPTSHTSTLPTLALSIRRRVLFVLVNAANFTFGSVFFV